MKELPQPPDKENRRLLEALFDMSPVGLFRLDAAGRYIQVSRKWRETAGLTLAQALGCPWNVAVHPDDRNAMDEAWDLALAARQSFRQECRFKTPGERTAWVQLKAEPLTDDTGGVTGFIGTLADISHRKRTEEELRQLAYYDNLTGLPNRSFFMNQLGRAMSVAKRTGHKVVLLSCDLDNFKDINDTLGHEQGDLLLQAIGSRLNACIRRGDTLCRLGGDEFVLLLPTVSDDAQVQAVAAKIMDSLQQPFNLTGTEIFISTSIGIAVHPGDAPDGTTLIRHADMAMNVAKGEGKNRYRFFSEDMNSRAMARMRMEAGLRQAMPRGELSLVYQPQYELGSGRLVGVEALLRWDSPELGAVPPGRFIPLAEATGQIHDIGRWVLAEACRQTVQWLAAHGHSLTVAVNLSGRQFMDGDIVATVAEVLENTGLDPSRLELEITETVLMRDAAQALETLNRLHRKGVRFAIDDFGTGYSSLVYLKKFPIRRIKIAREFIRDITTDDNDAAIAGTVVDMAMNLGMTALAEGVETREQADLLRELGCHEVQGFFFGRPVPPADIDALLD